MKSFSLLAAGVIALGFFSSPAQAQSARTFVSAQSGSDGNPCSRLAPCRTFARAYQQTSPGGEINTLDPGGYGSLTISKSISIVSGLGEAGILVPSGGTGITIAAGSSDKINLRGLVIEGGGTGATGITFTSGKSLTITNSVIRNVQQNGLDFVPPSTTSALTVVDTLVSDIGGVGIHVSAGNIDAFTSVMLQRVSLVNSNGGFYVDSAGFSTVVVEDSVVSHHAFSCIAFTSSGSGAVKASIKRSSSSFSGSDGIALDGAGVNLFLGESTIMMNALDLGLTNGATITTFKNNEINSISNSGGVIADGTTNGDRF